MKVFSLKICRISVLDLDFSSFSNGHCSPSLLIDIIILTMLSHLNPKSVPASSITYRKGNTEDKIKSTFKIYNLFIYFKLQIICCHIHYLSNINHQPLIGEIFFIVI